MLPSPDASKGHPLSCEHWFQLIVLMGDVVAEDRVLGNNPSKRNHIRFCWKDSSVNDSSISATNSASGAVPQIENFLKTVMQGLIGQESMAAATQRSNQACRPVVLPSESLWMAMLIGVLRGLKSMRAVWRLLVRPRYAVGDQAVYKRLEQEFRVIVIVWMLEIEWCLVLNKWQGIYQI